MTDETVEPNTIPEAPETPLHVQVVTPVVLELGKVRPKRIKAFKKGRGKLMNEVLDVLDEVASELDEEVEGKIFVPIVMVYEKRRKKKKRGFILPF